MTRPTLLLLLALGCANPSDPTLRAVSKPPGRPQSCMWLGVDAFSAASDDGCPGDRGLSTVCIQQMGVCVQRCITERDFMEFVFGGEE